MVILPLSGQSRAASSLISVVFPAPLVPMSATVSPERTEKVNRSTLGEAAPWGVKDTWSTLIAGAEGCAAGISSASGEPVPGIPAASVPAVMGVAAARDMVPCASDVPDGNGVRPSIEPGCSHVTGMPLVCSR